LVPSSFVRIDELENAELHADGEVLWLVGEEGAAGAGFEPVHVDFASARRFEIDR
jgi:hypothetical protein